MSKSWDHAHLEIDGAVAVVTLDRPDRANALSREVASQLREALKSSDRDDVHLVVIRSSGSTFCAGADVTEMRNLDAVAAESFIGNLHATLNAIRTHRSPVIAAVQGACLGAGLELMISCDCVLASEDASFGMPEPFVGMPSVIEAALLPQVIGLMRTRDLLLTGDAIEAQTALRYGMVTEVVPPAELDAAVERKAAQLLRHSPVALRLQKDLMNRWLNLPMDEAVTAGIRAFAMAVATGEPQRAIAEYWKGRS